MLLCSHYTKKLFESYVEMIHQFLIRNLYRVRSIENDNKDVPGGSPTVSIVQLPKKLGVVVSVAFVFTRLSLLSDSIECHIRWPILSGKRRPIHLTKGVGIDGLRMKGEWRHISNIKSIDSRTMYPFSIPSLTNTSRQVYASLSHKYKQGLFFVASCLLHWME